MNNIFNIIFYYHFIDTIPQIDISLDISLDQETV